MLPMAPSGWRIRTGAPGASACSGAAGGESSWKQSRKVVATMIDKSMQVLIVDDYKTMLRIIRNLLKQIEFHNVEEASDGSEAIAKLRTGNFGLVISDWNMMPMTGLQLLQEVRADSRLKTTPFIMITAESKTENVIAAKQAGVSNYIVKPFNAETLREKIEKVLGHV
jgi:two-component system chemotaxis response regulator CheY